MPPVRSQRARAPRLSPNERRASLVEAGIRVVARRGIGAMRPSEVAEEAGVSEATIYVYFSTREALIRAVLDEVGRYYALLAETAFREDGPLTEQLACMFERAAASLETQPDHARVWFNWGAAIRDDLHPSFLEAEARIIRVLADRVRRVPKSKRPAPDVHPQDLAHLILGLGERLARRKLAGASQRELRRFVRSALDLLLRSQPEIR